MAGLFHSQGDDKMGLVQLINALLGREPKYEHIDAKYQGNGLFVLSAEREDRRIIYNSHESYTGTTTSWFQDRPAEFTKFVPSITIHDTGKNETVRIMEDPEESMFAVYINNHHEPPLVVVELGWQIMRTDRRMGEETAARIISEYKRIFRQQLRLLDVKAHKKKALEATVNAYTV